MRLYRFSFLVLVCLTDHMILYQGNKACSRANQILLLLLADCLSCSACDRILNSPEIYLKAVALFGQKVLNHNLVYFICLYSVYRKKTKRAQHRAAEGRSRHKSHGVIQYQGLYFPTRCPKWIFIILIILVEKKHTKLIYHMPWLYQYPPLPFHRSYKNSSKILKNYPPWIMEVLK